MCEVERAKIVQSAVLDDEAFVVSGESMHYVLYDSLVVQFQFRGCVGLSSQIQKGVLSA
jgi:hypothetical protein